MVGEVVGCIEDELDSKPRLSLWCVCSALTAEDKSVLSVCACADCFKTGPTHSEPRDASARRQPPPAV